MQPRTPRQMGLSNGKKRRLDAGDDDDDATGLGMSRGTVRHRMKKKKKMVLRWIVLELSVYPQDVDNLSNHRQ